jgi:hypothetical protein
VLAHGKSKHKSLHPTISLDGVHLTISLDGECACFLLSMAIALYELGLGALLLKKFFNHVMFDNL